MSQKLRRFAIWTVLVGALLGGVYWWSTGVPDPVDPDPPQSGTSAQEPEVLIDEEGNRPKPTVPDGAVIERRAPQGPFADDQPPEDYAPPVDAGPPPVLPDLPEDMVVLSEEDLAERRVEQIQVIEARLADLDRDIEAAHAEQNQGMLSVLRARRQRLAARRVELQNLGP